MFKMFSSGEGDVRVIEDKTSTTLTSPCFKQCSKLGNVEGTRNVVLTNGLRVQMLKMLSSGVVWVPKDPTLTSATLPQF